MLQEGSIYQYFVLDLAGAWASLQQVVKQNFVLQLAGCYASLQQAGLPTKVR